MRRHRSRCRRSVVSGGRRAGRRLDPLDRVRELSDAFVPFNFDVHALFSEDAVGIEAKTHTRLADRRVNLIKPAASHRGRAGRLFLDLERRGRRR
ncbi:GIY-YIG nuclease family protein [Micromonospora cremea]|uniref:GIY-YIG nuclease family protein n=1 Tax=Micromonospora cremea TaxID=709881 RepID=UPI00313D59A7